MTMWNMQAIETSNTLRQVIKVILINIVLIYFLVGFATTSSAAVYYMPGDFPNLQAAMAAMAGGDELIIRDGVYKGEDNTIDNWHVPPSGSSDSYTVIRAEHPGEVVFDGQGINNMFYVDGPVRSYVLFYGLTWKSSNDNNTVYLGNWDHAKFQRCGFLDAGINAKTSYCGLYLRDGNYLLVEDCYVWGEFYYGITFLECQKSIMRRCVIRKDIGRGPRQSGLTVYSSQDIEIQNCIIIDCDQVSHYTGITEFFYGLNFPNTNGGFNGCHTRGTIVLNLRGMSASTDESSLNQEFTNVVFWDTDKGFYDRKREPSVYANCIFGMNKPESGWGAIIGGHKIRNSIILDNTTWGWEYGNPDLDYNCFYSNHPNYRDPSKRGLHDYCSENGNEINPYSSGLKYLLRIEPGSFLATAGENGNRVGPDITRKIGVTGTLWGEPGYNKITDEPLWPFPYEDIIRAKMRAYNREGVNGTRGFCADGQTLTKYIWEYLGNPIPPEIYGSQDNTPPHADAGQDQTVEDSDNNGSEAVTLDGSDSYNSDGSITSYSWTENGQSIASGVNPSVTLSVGTHQIQLTVTDNQGATSQDTVHVVVSPPEGDNSPPVISNVQASNVSSQTVTITWVTDEPSSSNVEYGTSTDYGQAANSADLVTTHSVSLSGLQPSTTYHYRVSSTDSSGNPSNSADFTFTTSGSSVQVHTLQDFEDGVLWVAGGNQDPTGNGRGWAFLSTGDGDKIEIDNIGANGTHHSLKITFSSSNDTIYFRSDDKTRDHMPEAKGANRMSFYIRFPEKFPIQQLPFRYDTWQLGTFIHDPNDWNDTHSATSESDHGIHHYYHRVTIEKVGNGWVKYIINTHPDQANYSGSTAPLDRGSEYFDNFGRFYFHFGPEAGGPDPGRPFTIWIDEVKFYYDDGSVGGQVHDGGQNDAGFDGQFFPDSSGASATPPTAPRNFSVE